MSETGWLVEEDYGGGFHWITLPEYAWPTRETEVVSRYDDYEVERHKWRNPIVRVKDAGQALRFARKQDAEAFIKMFDRFLLSPVATEHEWPSPPAGLAETLFDAIAHGDEAHRSWLQKAIADHFAGRPVERQSPPAGGPRVGEIAKACDLIEQYIADYYAAKYPSDEWVPNLTNMIACRVSDIRGALSAGPHTEVLSAPILRRIEQARQEERLYEGIIYENSRPRTDKWITLRSSDFEALYALLTSFGQRGEVDDG